MQCPECQKPVQADWQICPYCQAVLNIEQQSNPFAQPMTPVEAEPLPAGSAGQNSTADNLSGIIPYKNPKALIAYYTSIAGGLPFIGLPFAIAALVLGVMGLKDRKRDPKIRGAAHAWIGIGCGSIFTLLWGILAVVLVVGLLSGV